jgi:hypothetical protein
MFSIWKFGLELTEVQTIYMPEGADILSVQNQNGSLCIWALLSPTAPKVGRHFKVIGTGHKIETLADHKWIATVIQDQFVWHIFEIT